MPDPRRTAPRLCQRLRIRILRPGKIRTFAPASAQHKIPIDGPVFIHSAVCNTEPYPWGKGRRYTASTVCARCLLIQAAHWAPTTTEKDAILEAMQEQDWEASPSPRWPGDADFQLSPTQPVVRRSTAAPVVQVKSPPTLRSGNTEMQECLETASNNFPYHIISPPSSPHQIAPCVHHCHKLCVSATRFSSNQRMSASLCTMSSWRSPMHFRVHAACRRAGSALKYQRRTSASGTRQVQSNVAVKTVQKESRRQQAPSAPIQRRRTGSNKNRASSRPRRAEGLRAPAAGDVFFRCSANRHR